MEVPIMAYKRPDVRILCTVQAFWDQRISIRLDEPDEVDWRARKIKEFIDSNVGRVPLSLSDLCKHLALPMSGRQARRLFKCSMGIGFREYVKKRHLVRAAEHLQATNAPIKEIASEAGYQSTQTFARRFKEFFLATALEFRTLRRVKEVHQNTVRLFPNAGPRAVNLGARHRAISNEQRLNSEE